MLSLIVWIAHLVMGRCRSYWLPWESQGKRWCFSFKPTLLPPEHARLLPNISQPSLAFYCFRFCISQVLNTLFFLTLNSIWPWVPWACSRENPCFQRRGFVAKLAGSSSVPQGRWHWLSICDLFCDTELGDAFRACIPSLPVSSDSWRTDVHAGWQGTAGFDTPQNTHSWDCTLLQVSKLCAGSSGRKPEVWDPSFLIFKVAIPILTPSHNVISTRALCKSLQYSHHTLPSHHWFYNFSWFKQNHDLAIATCQICWLSSSKRLWITLGNLSPMSYSIKEDLQAYWTLTGFPCCSVSGTDTSEHHLITSQKWEDLGLKFNVYLPKSKDILKNIFTCTE